MQSTSVPSTRGYLLHITHYDPVWVKHKAEEKPFDLNTGLEVVKAVSDAGLNLLVIDPKDGVAYDSHPELERHYTQSKDVLSSIAEEAHSLGLSVAVKLNFAQSAIHQHNHWFAPHHDLFDNDEYWERAFAIIDELIEATGVDRYFHIGMDEDHDRSISQYIQAVETLHKGLQARSLTTLMWNDTACHWPRAEIHREKALAAEQQCDKDIAHIIWDYGDDIHEEDFKRCSATGRGTWGAPGPSQDKVRAMAQILNKNSGQGMLLTRWKACIPENRDMLLSHLADVRSVFRP